MQKQMSPEKKLQYMTETPLPRLIFSLAVPTIISMLITALYNLADTFFEAYGEDLIAGIPELFWELPGGKVSTVRYHYHDHTCQRFTEAFCFFSSSIVTKATNTVENTGIILEIF